MSAQDSSQMVSLPLEVSTRWLKAFQTLSEGVLGSTDSDEALELFVELATVAGGADGALVFLESLDQNFLCEAAYSMTPDEPSGFLQNAIGVRFEVPPESEKLLRAGVGVLWEESESQNSSTRPGWTQALSIRGPVLLVPIKLSQTLKGILAIVRKQGSAPFTVADQIPASAFALQALLSVNLITREHTQGEVELMEERERIGRDLHDLAIQGLFATGMKLRDLQRQIEAGAHRKDLISSIGEALASLDSSVAQIRGIVYRLKQTEEAVGLVESLQEEASSARGNLGFAPTLIVEVNDLPVTQSADDYRIDRANILSDAVAPDVVAVVREALANVAKHAKASSVTVNVSIHGSGRAGEIVVTIIDDGSGVDPSVTRESGLANMHRRANLRGGSFAVGAGPRGRGTSLVWRSPLA